MNEIDFVILWVDGSDPAWRREFAQARHLSEEDSSLIRYRDWQTLRYWFRSVERFAPWVRRIHFITWGHLPAWLETEHPKLHIVNHADYLPGEYRPTFNSNVIELNIHRIEGLAEQFVLFNDDTFLGRPASPEQFFRNGLPRDMACLSIPCLEPITHIILNNMLLIGAQYQPHAVIRRHPAKWFAPCYGAGKLFKNLLLLPWSSFSGIRDHHMPQAFLKRQFTRAWQTWGRELDATCRNPFRTLADHSQWLIRYDSLCRGEFHPISFGDCGLKSLTDESLEGICHDIETQRWRMLCINDSEQITDFEARSHRLCEAFERLLPERSDFER